ncbi:hypothetical protein JCM10212_004334 [Sporobolomyces blumeae]
MRRRDSASSSYRHSSRTRDEIVEHSLLRRRPSLSYPIHLAPHASSSPLSPTSSVSSSASAIDDAPIRDRPFHIHDRAHPSWLTGPLHDLELNLEKTRKAMEESEAEEVHTFPDASEAMRMRPILENATRKIRFGAMSAMNQVVAAGDLVAVAWGVRVEVWSATQNESAWCEVGGHGIIGTSVVTALAFSESGRYLCVGCSNGSLLEFDTATLHRNSKPALPVVANRHDAHPHHAVTLVKSVGPCMYTLDESGRLVVWLPSRNNLCSLHGHSKILQVPARPVWSEVIDGLLYLSYRYRAGEQTKGPLSVLEVYDVRGQQALLVGESEWEEGVKGHPGFITCACVVPSHRQYVFIGHDSGHVSIWQPSGAKMIDLRKVSLSGVTAMVGPSRFLWIGRADGMLDVLDAADMACWRVIKRWLAHDSAVEKLILDPRSLWTASQLRVVSSGRDGYVRFWDGLLRKDWITLRMQEKVEEYCTFTSLQVGIFTWNVDGVSPADFVAASPVNQTLLATFLKTLDNPELVSFNFQELIDLSDLTFAARTALFATKHHDVTLRYRHWRALLAGALLAHFGRNYELVHEEKLIGLYTAVFARKDVKKRLRDVEGNGIKTGFSASWGNKGSVLLRLVIDDTSICLVNSHLAAGTTAPGRRERDLIEIFDSGPKFTRPESGTKRAYVGGGDGTQISDNEIIIFSGDLNFRIDLPRRQVLAALASGSSTTIDDLLQHDELVVLRETSPSFRLRKAKEAAIRFPPTYKYDHGSTAYDTSPKQRTPSWCDRILWRSQLREESVKCLAYGRYEADVSDHRPISATFEVQVKKRNAVEAEASLRNVLHEWALEEERLLNTARSYYPLAW